MDEKLSALLNYDLGVAQETQTLDPREYFVSVSQHLCEVINQSIDADWSAMYSTGLRAGAFSRVCQVGTSATPDEFTTNDAGQPFIDRIREISFSDFAVFRSVGQFEWGEDRGPIFYLFSRGEIFGFLLMGIRPGRKVPVLEYFKENAVAINAIAADNAFAFRMNILSQAFPHPREEGAYEEELGGFVADLVACGFGADGCTFRLEHDGELEVVGSAGLVTDRIRSARRTGQALSGHLIESDEYDWTAVIMNEREHVDIGGMPTTPEIRNELRAMGLYSVLMCKIVGSEVGDEQRNYGTISYYFLRSTAYSRRDVALFRAFAKRLSSHISLYYAVLEMNYKNTIIETQGRLMTFSDISNLLSHDIWHKANDINTDANELYEYIDQETKSDRIRGNELRIRELKSKAEAVLSSSEDIYAATNRYRALYRKDIKSIYEVTTFSVADAIENVRHTLSPALRRKGVTINASDARTKIRGPSFLFEQVLYNLVINSIDALATVRQKQRTIDLHSHVANGRLIVRVSDNGPGVSHVAFPDPNEVFLVGRTSKESGTGMGLPMARQILGTHFKGNLNLTSRHPAVFTIDIPAHVGS